MRKIPILLGCLLLAVAGCGHFNGPPTITPTPWRVFWSTEDVTVAAGMSEVSPATTDTLSASVSLSRFGLSGFDRVYEMETPAGQDFSFTVIARGAGNFGLTQLSVGHVADNGLAPALGAESIVAAGMHLEGSSLSYNGNLVEVIGDGFSRVTVRGSISTDQVLLVQVPRWWGLSPLNIGLRVRIGNSSIINLPNHAAPPTRPGMVTTPVFSSNSWYCGLPAIAVSGDRYSVATYDGTGIGYGQRRRQWLQLDAATSTVTGGQADCYSDDIASWRDQEIAARGNVLAVVYSQAGDIRAEISLDRGASFPLLHTLESSGGWGAQRLVQIAIAPDYTLGVLYWRCSGGTASLRLCEAAPTGFDANNTPTGYAWTQNTVVHNPGSDVTPLLMHLEYSAGGDLVVGYGYSLFQWVGGQRINSARFRCAVRPWGGAWRDSEVDREDRVAPIDPHVAVLGSGAAMEVFYAYEKTDGVHLKYSADAGLTWQTVAHVAIPGAMQPSVHPRLVGGLKRVDMLYANPVGWGLELHNLRWDDFTPGQAGQPFALTRVSSLPGGTPPPGCPQGMVIRTLGWLGYDAVVRGDQVAVVVHELNYDVYAWWNAWGLPAMTGWAGGTTAAAASGGSGAGSYQPAPPPPMMLPGMTGTVPAPNTSDRSLLSVIVMD